jgi:hypothetical protein
MYVKEVINVSSSKTREERIKVIGGKARGKVTNRKTKMYVGG